MRHDELLYLSKYYGLIYLVIFFVAVLVYSFWPRNKDKFHKAARSIIENSEDKPDNER